jgi:hypothetical protein
MRAYGNKVYDNPFDEHESTRIDVEGEITIELLIDGTKLYYESRCPTEYEVKNCPRVVMTDPAPWNPRTVVLGAVDVQAGERQEPFYQGEPGSYEYNRPYDDEAILHSIDPSLVELRERIVSQIKIKACPRVIAPVDVADADERMPRRTFVSTGRHSRVSADQLAERFLISTERAKATMRATTQRGIRSAILPLARRYRADRYLELKRLKGKFSTDALFGPCRSLNGNVATQLFHHKCGFNAPYHLRNVGGEETGNALQDMIHEYGAPDHLTFDGASSQLGPGTKFMQTIKRADIRYHVSEKERPNNNPAESGIREVKKRWYRVKEKKHIPERLWDYGISWVCETGNVTANGSRYSRGRTPLEIVSGSTPDITEHLDFGLYDWVTFRNNAGLGESRVGKWLGVSHRIGSLLSYWVLPSTGIPISTSTVQRVPYLTQQTDEWAVSANIFDAEIKVKLEAENANVNLTGIQQGKLLDLEHEDQDFVDEYTRVIDNPDVPHMEDLVSASATSYVGMELGIRRGADSELMSGSVKRRAVDVDGQPIGMANNNPLLDSRQYEIEYINGDIETLTANIIAENLLSQVDEEGHRQMMMDEILDHRTTKDALTKDNGTYQTARGLTRKKRTTKGWEIYVQWRDGSGDWVALKDLKDSYPVELAEYATTAGIQDQPAFAWWIPYVLKKRTRIVAKLKSKYWERTHKYGLEVPRTLKDVERIDRENGNKLWQDSVDIEMRDVMIAFEEIEGNPDELIGYEEITGHLVFDIKLGENFRRKSRFCADGHKTKPSASVTYSTVVARDSVRLILLIAALNGLNVLGSDVQNAFLTAPNKEKCWIRAGPEFGDNKGKCYIVARALYGLKSAGASFRSFMAQQLDDMDFKPCPADPDVWMRSAKKPDGEDYYEYVMTYVDDLIAVSHNPMGIMKEIETTFKFKGNKIEEPSSYLGARLQKKNINGWDCWTITSQDYVNAAVANVEKAIEGTKWKLPTKAITPMTSAYIPELDGTPELDEKDTQYFQELIGMLRWATEIGRVDILHEVSILSQYQASPRQGHLEEAIHIFGYLKRKPKLTLYMNPELPNIQYSDFVTTAADFQEYYRGAEEEMPHNMPIPKGNGVKITVFVDASHGANKVTRRSHTGFIIFVNRAPIMWYSKRQQTVESSAFSSEFIALKIALESLEGLRFKLRMFGVPLPKGDPAQVYCDNEAVVKNSTKVESSLNKKHSSIAYHFTRWIVAASVATVAWIKSADNLADAMTKRLTEATRDYLFGNWTY